MELWIDVNVSRTDNDRVLWERQIYPCEPPDQPHNGRCRFVLVVVHRYT
ncbi:hypothetical protein ACVWWN_005035 [Mycobacterium sp. URHB0021]